MASPVSFHPSVGSHHPSRNVTFTKSHAVTHPSLKRTPLCGRLQARASLQSGNVSLPPSDSGVKRHRPESVAVFVQDGTKPMKSLPVTFMKAMPALPLPRESAISPQLASPGLREGFSRDLSQHKAQDVDELWLRIREEARDAADAAPALASYLYTTVLAHRSLESALAAHLANKIASPTLLSPHLLILFRDVFMGSPAVCAAFRRDIRAAFDRDPACSSYLHCLMNFKGFSALQVHRVAHELWQRGRRGLALALQSRSSEVFHVDIHPAAKFGSGVVLDHATGVVVGETAEVGDDVTMLHNVTLGGTGTVGERRHPKVESEVVLGAGVRVLGAIRVGRGAKVGACSLVLDDIGDGVTVVGAPAREVKKGDFILDFVI